MRSKNPALWPHAHIFCNSLMPYCVTIAEPPFDRKAQKFNILRSARSARQDSRFGCRQVPAQAFHDQPVDLLKELLRYSDVVLRSGLMGCGNLITLDFCVAITHLFRRFAVEPRSCSFPEARLPSNPKSAPRSPLQPAGRCHYPRGGSHTREEGATGCRIAF
jgi:hypothetical protein